MANYHPSDELLMSFAAGQLPNALGIVAACHLETCQQCQAKVQMYELLGAKLIDAMPAISMSDDSLNNLLDRMDLEPTTVKLPEFTGDPRTPRPLRRFMPEYFDQLTWRGFTSGIKEYILPFSDDTYTAKFYKISAGKELPIHTHKGNEFTLVMEGSFSDNAGDYHLGDFILADTQTIHQPKAAIDCDCICFAVVDAPLKMTGFFGRMLNPFL
ncbi:MAG: putative transcriptional regulator [Pseudohongiellaceae bacterium]|jgi:putative transcriptional regulator